MDYEKMFELIMQLIEMCTEETAINMLVRRGAYVRIQARRVCRLAGSKQPKIDAGHLMDELALLSEDQIREAVAELRLGQAA